jgi:hypothetical protein
MALKFQPPNLPETQTPAGAINDTLGKTIQGLPMLYAQIKMQKMQHDMQLKALERQMQGTQFDQDIKTQELGLRKDDLDLQRQKEERMAGNQSELLDIKKQLAEIAGNKAANTFSPAEKAVDANFGKEYADYVAGGGFTETQKKIGQLESVIQKLESGAVDTGVVSGVAAKLPWTKSRAAKENVEEVVQQNLRAVLGGQFAQQEGKELVSRAYNASQPPEENIKRLKNLLTQIKGAAAAKQQAIEYFEKNGSLRGFNGSLATMSQFNPEADANPSQASAEPAPTITSKQDYDALPSGSEYIWNGVKKRKK